MREVRIGGSTATLVPVIRGLISEASRIRNLLDSEDFDVIGVSIAPEELQTLREGLGEGAAPSNVEEEVYMRELARFGQVAKPPPCFVEAVAVSQSKGIQCIALDLDEEAFTDLYCQEIRSWDLIRYTRDLKKLRGMSFQADSPEEFVRTFDSVINGRKGYKRLEQARETHIAASVRELCTPFRRPLALVEAERFPGVVEKLA